MAQSIDEKVQSLESNIHKLIDALAASKKQTLELKAEETRLKAEVEDLKGRLEDFQNQDKIAKLVSSTTVEKEDSTELKHKLNEYIKEIDRCITHLS